MLYSVRNFNTRTKSYADYFRRFRNKKSCRPQSRAKITVVILLFLTAAVLSAVFMGRVAINYNLADYLVGDTQTQIAPDIM